MLSDDDAADADAWWSHVTADDLDRIEAALTLASAVGAEASRDVAPGPAAAAAAAKGAGSRAMQDDPQAADAAANTLDIVQLFRALSAIEQHESDIGARMQPDASGLPAAAAGDARAGRNLARTVLLLMAHKMPGMSWWDRLRTLQKEIDMSTIPHVELEHEDFADEDQSAKRMRTTARGVVTALRKSAIKTKADVRTFQRRHLLVRAFERWRHVLETTTQRRERLSLSEARTALMRERTQRLDAAAQQFELRRAWAKWRLAAYKTLTTTAAERATTLKHECFAMWMRRAHLRRTSKTVATRISVVSRRGAMANAFQIWRAGYRKREGARRMGAVFARVLEDRRMRLVKADAFYGKNLAARACAEWIARTCHVTVELPDAAQSFVARAERSHVQQAFVLWRTRSAVVQEHQKRAHMMRRYNLLRSGLEDWRELLTKRESVLQRRADTRVVQRMFAIWKERHDHNRKNRRLALAQHAYTLKSAMFDRWRSALERVNWELRIVARVRSMQRKRQLHRIMAAWHGFVAKKKLLQSLLEIKAAQTVARKKHIVLLTWHAALMHRRRGAIEHVLSERRKDRVKRIVLQHWHWMTMSTQISAYESGLARIAGQKHRGTVLRKVFGRMRQTFEHRMMMQEAAVAMHRHSALRASILAWMRAVLAIATEHFKERRLVHAFNRWRGAAEMRVRFRNKLLGLKAGVYKMRVAQMQAIFAETWFEKQLKRKVLLGWRSLCESANAGIHASSDVSM
nr:hypothetical protein HK105_000625 [Polyrhizophydium stewartii]